MYNGRTDQDWQEFFTNYCRDRFIHHHETKNLSDALFFAFEDTIELRQYPKDNPKATLIPRNLMDEWASDYNSVVTTVDSAYENNCAEHIRICQHCGFPMIEGYEKDGVFTCCEECYKAELNEDDCEYHRYRWETVTHDTATVDRFDHIIVPGSSVKWYDPDESARDTERIWKVDDVRGDVVCISDDCSEAEVFNIELEVL